MTYSVLSSPTPTWTTWMESRLSLESFRQPIFGTPTTMRAKNLGRAPTEDSTRKIGSFTRSSVMENLKTTRRGLRFMQERGDSTTIEMRMAQAGGMGVMYSHLRPD